MNCWNCGSPQYSNSLPQIEECLSCGIFCDYWGTGANDKYKAAMRVYELREDHPEWSED